MRSSDVDRNMDAHRDGHIEEREGKVNKKMWTRK